MTSIGAAAFAALMDGLGPFEPRPLVAVAVSGGADSLAAAVLSRDWVRARHGDVLAIVVDHGLRAESTDEVRLTLARLRSADIPAVTLCLHLVRGPGLAERARAARHAVLEQECAARGILHLVFGHHAGDQAETVAMRLLARSGPAGLAGMARLVETPLVRRLRPLLGVAPARLRATLVAAGLSWVEDPSNADPAQLRARLRRLRGDPAGVGLATRALLAASAARGHARLQRERGDAVSLAEQVRLYPEGFAVLTGPLSPSALAALLGLVSGATRPPSESRVLALAANPRPATMAGVRLLPAGRLGPGLLLVREAVAIAPPCPARALTVWDGRFQVQRDIEGAEIGAWGTEAPRDRGGLPAAVLRTLPALRRDGRVVSAGVTLLAGPDPVLQFAPRGWMTGAGYVSLSRDCVMCCG